MFNELCDTVVSSKENVKIDPIINFLVEPTKGVDVDNVFWFLIVLFVSRRKSRSNLIRISLNFDRCIKD